MAARTYIFVRWRHTSLEDPIELWSELDDGGYETRKVEVWQDGRVGFASADFEFGGTSLGEKPLPSIREIAADPQFEAAEIDQSSFEARWWDRHLSSEIRARIERTKLLKADLVADVTLYEAQDVERQPRLLPGFGCPIALSDPPIELFETRPLLGNDPLLPGESRRIGFAFLLRASAAKVQAAGYFVLWAGRAFGEGKIVR